MAKTIGINALFLIPNQVGGTEYHLRSFVKYLQQIDFKNRYILFCNEENFNTFSLVNPLWRRIKCPIKATNRMARIIYEQASFPKLVESTHCDVLHSFGYFGPARGDFKKVLTIHDANWKDCPEDSSRLQNFVLNVLISISLKKSQLVITDSPFSLSRLRFYFPQDAAKFKVVQPGIEEVFLMPSTDHLPLSIQKPYLLCVSAFYPHKQIEYLLQLWETMTKKGTPAQLVIVGHNGSQLAKLRPKLEYSSQVKWLPKIKVEELVSLYRHAQAFIFPSTYEGFGYPVYEALAAGLPTLVGKKELYIPEVQSSLRELTFNESTDVKLLSELLLQKPRLNSLPVSDYKRSAGELVKLYAQL